MLPGFLNNIPLLLLISQTLPIKARELKISDAVVYYIKFETNHCGWPENIVEALLLTYQMRCILYYYFYFLYLGQINRNFKVPIFSDLIQESHF